MNSSNKYSEFLGYDDDGNMRMRLGHTIYVQKGFKFYMEVNGELTRIPLETLVAKPWIQRNFEAEKIFQRRKQLAIDLQSSHIPSYERRAYKQSRGRGWNNSTGWN